MGAPSFRAVPCQTLSQPFRSIRTWLKPALSARFFAIAAVVLSTRSPDSQAARAAVGLVGPRRAGAIMRPAASCAEAMPFAITFGIISSLIRLVGVGVK